MARKTVPGRRRKTDLVVRLPCLLLGLAIVGTFATWNPAADAAEAAAAAARRLDETDVSMYPNNALDGHAGAWIVYLIGVMYMFIALAIICDEYFVPALSVMGIALNLPKDVMGATLMAAGGSAPELFTSFVGVYIAKSQVGFGTIVGSAVFNVLFVIAACAWAATKTKEGFLKLTWWPLFRDSVCYGIGLVALVLSFQDKVVEAYESALLFGLYLCYVAICKNTQYLERTFKSWLMAKGWMKKPEEDDEEADRNANPMLQGLSHDVLFSARQLAHRVRRDSAQQAHARDASLSVGSSRHMVAARPQSRRTSVMQAGNLQLLGAAAGVDAGAAEAQAVSAAQKKKAMRRNTASIELANTRSKLQELESLSAVSEDAPLLLEEGGDGDGGGGGGDLAPRRASGVVALADSQRVKVLEHMLEDIRLELDTRMDSIEDNIQTVLQRQEANAFFPPDVESQGARFMYVIQWPLNYVLRLTLVYIEEPDEDDDEGDDDDGGKERPPLEGNDRFYLYTFLGSIAWIGFFSYFMVWWASLLGNAWGVSDVVMGVTILAAGTSVPDLASSVIVTKQGQGDQALSSSIGSNIFDILVGLPLPWCSWSLINGEGIDVESDGLLSSVLVLFVMVILVIASIAYNNWELGYNLGVMMFCLYILFLVQHLLVEYGYIG